MLPTGLARPARGMPGADGVALFPRGHSLGFIPQAMHADAQAQSRLPVVLEVTCEAPRDDDRGALDRRELRLNPELVVRMPVP